LAVTSSTQAAGTAKKAGQYFATTTTGNGDYATKKAKLLETTTATTIDGCFSALNAGAGNAAAVNCYGPSLYYSNHPNHTSSVTGGAEVAICPTTAGNAPKDGCLPSGDLGLWSSAESDGTACSAAKMNSLVTNVAQKVDVGLGSAAMMLCVARINGRELPAVGATLDLLTDLTAAEVVAKGMTVTSGTLTRNADTAAGYASYTSSLNFSYTPNGSSTAETFGVTLNHVPFDASNDTYKGLLKLERSGGTQTTGKTVASVVYEQTATKLTYKLILAEFASTVTSYYGTDGQVLTSGWNQNLNTMIASVDSSGYGDVAYSWQAGSQDGWTRTFNVSTTGTGGTAYFGFAQNASNSPKFSIDGMLCNWAGPSNQRTALAFVQKQTLAPNASGIWASTADKIAYSPTNDCSWAANQGYYSTSPVTATQVFTTAQTHALASTTTDYSFTVPTAPTAP